MEMIAPYLVLSAVLMGLIMWREVSQIKSSIRNLERKFEMFSGISNSDADAVVSILPSIENLLNSGNIVEAKRLAAEKLTSPEEFKRLNVLLQGRLDG